MEKEKRHPLFLPGLIGTLVLATCSFTPVLETALSWMGLGTLKIYMHVVLLPLLGLFCMITYFAFYAKDFD